MVIPISFAALLIPIRLRPAAILAPERNVLWVLAADAVHATCKRTTRFGTSCVRSTARGCPATATDLRAAARPVFQRATRRNNLVSALSRTRCRADRLRPAICRFACAPLKCALIEVAPVDVIRQLHAGEFGADLPARKFVEFLFGGGACSQRCHGKTCKRCDAQPPLRWIPPRAHRSKSSADHLPCGGSRSTASKGVLEV